MVPARLSPAEHSGALTMPSAVMESSPRLPYAFVPTSVAGSCRERDDRMNATTHQKCEDDPRRPAAV